MKDPHRYAVKVSDTTMMTRAASLPGQHTLLRNILSIEYFFSPAAIGILLVQVAAFFIIAFVMVHAHGRRMALVQPVKNMLAVRIAVSNACMAKHLL